MSTEKTWYQRANINLNGSSTTEVAQNFMFQLFTTLSGGNGNSTAKWEIVSASDGSSVAAGGTNITAPSDFVFNTAGNAHSWFVARKSNILPNTGSGARYLYFYADCEDTTGNKAYFAWDHQAPSSAGSTTNRPSESSYAAEKDGQLFFRGYEAGFPTYYHSCIDSTGSFHVITSRGNDSLNPYRFAMSCARLEAPRATTADPFPVFLKCAQFTGNPQYYNNDVGGPWSIRCTSDGAVTDWADTVGYAQGAWRADSSFVTGDEILLMNPFGYDGVNSYNPFVEFGPGADPIDGKWPLCPTFLFTSNGTGNPMGMRGRLPDVHLANTQYYTDGGTNNNAHANWMAGATVPQTGSITHSCVGQYWLPFTGSLLPGYA